MKWLKVVIVLVIIALLIWFIIERTQTKTKVSRKTRSSFDKSTSEWDSSAPPNTFSAQILMKSFIKGEYVRKAVFLTKSKAVVDITEQFLANFATVSVTVEEDDDFGSIQIMTNEHEYEIYLPPKEDVSSISRYGTDTFNVAFV